ncbi:MAG: hypothetical protein OEV66_08590 [Spirochaetia bacterium]|nr:hypothetical protein [Spirochaetia bacterium]
MKRLIVMIIRLRKRLKEVKRTGFAEGEMAATKRCKKKMNALFQEHEKQVHEILRSHRVEIKILEKEYLFKQARLEKKMKKLDDLIREWETNIYSVREIASQSKEVLARIKQIMYQDRKALANALDDEATIEMLQVNLNNIIQKQGNLSQNRA